MSDPSGLNPSSLTTAAVTVRPAAPSDTPGLRRIEVQSFQSDVWSEEDFLAHPCLVAVIADAKAEPGAAASAEPCLAGYIVSRVLFDGGEANSASTEREILNLAVDPAFRRRGIGGALLRAELARGGIHFLEVRESNAAARELYRTFGFVVVGRRKAYYESPREPAILMRRDPPSPSL